MYILSYILKYLKPNPKYKKKKIGSEDGYVEVHLNSKRAFHLLLLSIGSSEFVKLEFLTTNKKR